MDIELHQTWEDTDAINTLMEEILNIGSNTAVEEMEDEDANSEAPNASEAELASIVLPSSLG